MKRRSFLQCTAAGVALSTYLDLPARAEEANRSNQPGVFGQGNWKYKQIENWGVLDPKQVPVKNLHEIAQDKNGSIYVMGDEAKNNILVYNAAGELERTLLSGIGGGHGLTICEEDGVEYLWVTNTSGGDAFARKVTLEGETVMQLGRPNAAPYAGTKARYSPTEVEVNPANGDIFVADGYGSSVLARYDRTGKLLDIYGKDQGFSCMHGVRLDNRNPDEPLLWVTSRADDEIRLMTLEGKTVKVLKFPSVGPCRATFVDDHVVIPIIWITRTNTVPRSAGFVMVLGPDNQPVSFIGGVSKTLDNGKESYAQDSEAAPPFIFPHDTYIDKAGDLYVAQWNSNQTYPLKFKRVS